MYNQCVYKLRTVDTVCLLVMYCTPCVCAVQPLSTGQYEEEIILSVQDGAAQLERVDGGLVIDRKVWYLPTCLTA
jgi:hypothetical protein